MLDCILIVRDYRSYLHSHINTSVSLDADAIASGLEEAGFEVQFTSHRQLANSELVWTLRDHLVFYTSSQIPDYKQYIDCVLYPLHLRNVLLPSYELFRCHEDKAFQEVVRRGIGLGRPGGLLFGSLRELEQHRDSLDFPCVLKLPAGFGSSSVWRVDSYNQCCELIRKLFSARVSLARKTVRGLKWLLRLESTSMDRVGGPVGRFVIQDFIPQLEHDWKVLVFGDRYYALKRLVRTGDFRASGSGRLVFARPSDMLLDFARDCKERLNTPFASLDIVESEDGRDFFLIEFQATHFGPYTQLHSEIVYTRDENGEWRNTRKTSSLEEDFIYSIVFFADALRGNCR